MREVARKSENERRELFSATAERMRVHPAIVEKDFWVCWVLDYLFHESAWKDALAFKGGTSLSKGYGAIERFSEDIDLILDWRLLGYEREAPLAELSATKLDALGKEANERTVAFLAQQFAPALGPDLSDRAGALVGIEASGQDVLVRYPRAFALAAIQPQIKLEIGPMAAWVPHEERPIVPYAAEHYPHLFTQRETLIRTIKAERTFWEKATILHQEAHREPERPLPLRYSRHYYDLYRLSRLPIRERALADLDLLSDVVQFKMRFYRCAWAHYETAVPGTLHLLPAEHNRASLRRDYEDMRAMLFGEVPTFDQIMDELAHLEHAINETRQPGV